MQSTSDLHNFLYKKLSLKELVDEAIIVSEAGKALSQYSQKKQLDFKSACQIQILAGKTLILCGMISLKAHEDSSDEARQELSRYTKALQGRMEIFS